jgi:hypothetical protein
MYLIFTAKELKKDVAIVTSSASVCKRATQPTDFKILLQNALLLLKTVHDISCCIWRCVQIIKLITCGRDRMFKYYLEELRVSEG